MADEVKPDETGRAIGENSTFVQDGQLYTLAGLTYRVRAAYSNYLYTQAIQSAFELAQKGIVADIDRVLTNLCNDKAAGKFRWGGEICNSSLQDDENRAMFVYLQLLPKHKDIKLKTVQEWFDKESEKLYKLSQDAIADPTLASSTPEPAASA